MSSRFIASAVSLVLSQALFANASITVKNNMDVPLTLSQSNYNRLVVKGDKIVDLAFPEQAMGIKRDEQDGSVYVMLNSVTPFTLFLATESGRHFSVTVSGEDSLGKTIELVPAFSASHIKPTNPVGTQEQALSDEQSLISLIYHMETHQPLSGFTVKNTHRIERWQKGLTLTNRQTWQNGQLMGEVIELYNASHTPLILDEAWFNQDGTSAVKLSQKQLLSKQTALLYRVTGAVGEGVRHG